MRTCPHCQFIVHDGADICGVCKQPATVPEQPAGPWGAIPSFDPDAPGPGIGTATATQARPATFVNPSPPRHPVNGLKVAAIAVGGVALVVILGVVALSFVGTTASTDVDPEAVGWTPYRDPDGNFSVELPGAVEPLDVGSEKGLPTGVSIKGVMSQTSSHSSSALRYVLPPGTAYDLDGGIDGAAANTFSDAVISNRTPVETPYGPAIDAEIVGTVATGQKGISFVRLVKVGDVPYMLLTVGDAASSPELAELHERMVASFSSPAAP